MPNRRTHVVAGTLTGGGAALWCARDQEICNRALEVAGGALAGYWGGRLPDIFDPPNSPNHRARGHGAGTALVAGAKCIEKIPEWQADLRRQADEFAALAKGSDNDLARFGYLLFEALARMGVGAIPGLAAGYASHLVLDGTTKHGLPVF